MGTLAKHAFVSWERGLYLYLIFDGISSSSKVSERSALLAPVTRLSKQTCITYSSKILKPSWRQYFVTFLLFMLMHGLKWPLKTVEGQLWFHANRAETQPVCVFTIQPWLFDIVVIGSGIAMDTLSWTACLWQICWQCGHVFEKRSHGNPFCGQDISA